ncbi:MAG: SAM-dependent chlorinase/fluorinase [Flavobacteriales bacterium]|nr:SAM-dependent chlorinase/fluorinase [Flavobacteriales bacterium]NNK81416.1 SAM-dependent chlorinase/fluorinase [Flavobacteriales bacterium]
MIDCRTDVQFDRIQEFLMAIITLTTDMGLRDYYVASVKAAILRSMQEVQIIDISHDVEKFNISQAAFHIRNSFYEFPERTVHIIGVRPELTTKNAHVIVSKDGQYLIGADNGIFSFIFDSEPEEVFEITINQDTDDMTFPTKDLFTKAAVHLAKGGTPEVIGRKTELKTRFNKLQAITDASSIRGHVTHVDSYENVITNISEEMFKEIGQGREFQIHFRREQLRKIHKTYNSVETGEAVALFNSRRFLEISFNQGSYHGAGGASTLFGLKVDDMIRIEFE